MLYYDNPINRQGRCFREAGMENDFEKYKEYELPEGKLYNWSSINSMNDWQIFRSADICDDFYVVVANNKPLYVYNTKFFKLQ